MPKAYLPLFLWLGAAYVLCLMPGPIYWEAKLSAEAPLSVGRGDLAARERTEHKAENLMPASRSAEAAQSVDGDAKSLSPKVYSLDRVLDAVLNDHRSVKELGAHFILMFGIAFCFVRVFNSSQFSTLRSLVFILLLALSIEFLQELLPTSFARGFALSDIWVSLAGGLLGALLGSLVKQAGGFRLEALGRRRSRIF